MLECIDKGDKDKLYASMGNILETVTVKKYTVIDEIKNELLEAGAVNSLMSGSGPTVFAIFDNEETALAACENISKKFELEIAKVVSLI